MRMNKDELRILNIAPLGEFVLSNLNDRADLRSGKLFYEGSAQLFENQVYVTLSRVDIRKPLSEVQDEVIYAWNLVCKKEPVVLMEIENDFWSYAQKFDFYVPNGCKPLKELMSIGRVIIYMNYEGFGLRYDCSEVFDCLELFVEFDSEGELDHFKFDG